MTFTIAEIKTRFPYLNLKQRWLLKLTLKDLSYLRGKLRKTYQAGKKKQIKEQCRKLIKLVYRLQTYRPKEGALPSAPEELHSAVPIPTRDPIADMPAKVILRKHASNVSPT